MGKSSAPAGNTTTTTNSSPWSAQQPYLQSLFQNAQDAYNSGSLAPQAYNGQLVANPSGITSQTQNSLYNLGMNGGPATNDAINYLGNAFNTSFDSNPGSGQYSRYNGSGGVGVNTLTGLAGNAQTGSDLLTQMAGDSYVPGSSQLNNYANGYGVAGDQGLSQAGENATANPFSGLLAGTAMNGGGSNPYLDQMFNQGANAVQSRLQSEFAGNGRSNSGAETADLSDQYNQLANQIYGGAYDANANRALSAAQSGASNYNTGIGNQINAFGTEGQLGNQAVSNSINAASSLGGLANQRFGMNESAASDLLNSGLSSGNSLLNAGLTAAGGLSNNYGNWANNMTANAGQASGLTNSQFSGLDQANMAGGQQDTYQQNLINSLIQQYNQNSGRPMQSLGDLAGLISGNFGGTSSTSQPYFMPSTGQNLLSGGLSAALIYSLLSDRRSKTDIRRVGTARNGVPLYRFRYLGSDIVHLGTIAQEAQAIKPDAVFTLPDGLLAVDYATVFEEAA